MWLLIFCDFGIFRAFAFLMWLCLFRDSVSSVISGSICLLIVDYSERCQPALYNLIILCIERCSTKMCPVLQAWEILVSCMWPLLSKRLPDHSGISWTGLSEYSVDHGTYVAQLQVSYRLLTPSNCPAITNPNDEITRKRQTFQKFVKIENMKIKIMGESRFESETFCILKMHATDWTTRPETSGP